jgi:hypothetical protein
MVGPPRCKPDRRPARLPAIPRRARGQRPRPHHKHRLAWLLSFIPSGGRVLRGQDRHPIAHTQPRLPMGRGRHFGKRHRPLRLSNRVEWPFGHEYRARSGDLDAHANAPLRKTGRTGRNRRDAFLRRRQFPHRSMHRRGWRLSRLGREFVKEIYVQEASYCAFSLLYFDPCRPRRDRLRRMVALCPARRRRARSRTRRNSRCDRASGRLAVC